jgi:hypothetical protein
MSTNSIPLTENNILENKRGESERQEVKRRSDTGVLFGGYNPKKRQELYGSRLLGTKCDWFRDPIIGFYRQSKLGSTP